MTLFFFFVFLWLRLPVDAAAMCALWCGAWHYAMQPVPVSAYALHPRPLGGWG